MKSIKLTKDMKSRIVKGIITETFKKRDGAVKKKESDLAEKIYGECVGPYLVDMDRLPEEFFKSTSSLYVKFKNASRLTINIDLRQPKRIPAFAEYSNIKEYPESHKYTKQYVATIGIRQIIREEKDELKEQLFSILAGVRTSKGLNEVFPEGVKFLPEEKKPTGNLPVVDVSGIREMMVKFSA